MSKDEEERLAFAGRVVFYSVIFFMASYAFHLTGAA